MVPFRTGSAFSLLQVFFGANPYFDSARYFFPLTTMSTPSVSSVELPVGKTPILSVVPMPANANQHGDIFGGWIMSQVDIAGGVVAARRSRGRVATVAVNSFVFKQPVLIGDIVLFYAEVVKVGRTSLTVNVQVYAQRNPAILQTVRVTEAQLTYVATDSTRKPRPVPPEVTTAQTS